MGTLPQSGECGSEHIQAFDKVCVLGEDPPLTPRTRRKSRRLSIRLNLTMLHDAFQILWHSYSYSQYSTELKLYWEKAVHSLAQLHGLRGIHEQ